MSGPHASHQRKRPRSRICSGDAEQQPHSKKLRSCGSPEVSDSDYLHTLSKVWLTKEALRELNRTTKRSGATRARLTGRRPLTRAFHAELQSGISSASTPASTFLQHCTQKSLEELRRFAKHGGPDIKDLRGYPEPAQHSRYTMSSAQSRVRKPGKKASVSASQTQATSTTSKVTKSSGSKGPNFRQRLNDNAIYEHGYEYPDGRFLPKPEDWEDIKQMLAVPRASLSPSVYPEEKFQEFERADIRVSVEVDARESVISRIQGVPGPSTRIGREILFNNITNMLPHEARAVEDEKGPIGGANIRPDYFYGAHPGLLNNLEIRDELSQYIIPSTESPRPILPNFFLEAKGPKGSGAHVLNQACIDGAIGARAMHKLQTYGQETPSYNNRTCAISTTYKDGTLKMYAHHLGQPNGPGTLPEYYMNQLKAWALTSDRETLLRGITAFRNAEGWAEAQRNSVIEHAKAVYAQQHASPQGDGNDDNDEEDNDEDGNDEDEEEEDEPVNADPMLSSFTSQSGLSTDLGASRKGKAVR